jgi:PAS domain-containing protein
MGPSVASPRLGLNQTIARLFFGLGCGIALAAALLYGFLNLQLQPGMRELLVTGCTLLALGFAAAMPLLGRVPLGSVVLGVSWGGVGITALTAVGVGEGIHSPSLGFFGLLVCLVTVLTSLRAGMVLAATCALAVLALAGAEAQGWLPGPAAVQRNPRLLSVMLYGLMLGGAVVAGTQISRMLRRAMAQAEEREQRFRALLAIAADWYWELDAELRFSRIADHLLSALPGSAEARLGMHPWEASGVVMSPIDMDQHRQDLQAHRAFSDLLVQRTGTRGTPHFFRVSGQPHFDIEGRFTGYWGVGRNVTEEMRSREAHTASSLTCRPHRWCCTARATPSWPTRRRPTCSASARPKP